MAVETASDNKKRAATRVSFFLAGVSVATWAPLVPYAKARLDVDEAKFGFLLLFMGIGAVGCMPLCQRAVERFGCRKVIGAGAGMICASLPLLATLSGMPEMAITLLIFGAGLGFVDVAMNIQATLIERQSGEPLMSGFHGLFSVGGIAGSLAGGSLLSAGANPLGVAGAMVAVITMLMYRYVRYLEPAGRGERAASTLILPQGVVVLMGAIAIACFLVEGAMLDWSALFLTSVKSYTPDRAGFGYTVFAMTMAGGRLRGDVLIVRFGPRAVIVSGGILGAVGLSIAIACPSGTGAIIGFAVCGAGCANVVPILFAAAGRQTAMDPSSAISSITTLGYGGNLVGPAIVGFFAHAIGLHLAFALLAGLLLLAAYGGRKITS
jgi:MFS family permease